MKKFLAIALLSLSTAGWAQTSSNYQATVLAQSPTSYFKLDGNLVDSVGGSLAFGVEGIGGFFATDAFRNLTNAYAFVNQSDGLVLGSDVIAGGDSVGTNASANATGTISILFRTLDGLPGGQRFVFSQGNTTTNGNALGLFFENGTNTAGGALKLRVGSVTSVLLDSNNVAAGTWYYFAMTYDETRDSGEVQWYLGKVGGALAMGTVDIANDAVVGDNATVTLGNKADLASGFRNPGAGRVDEFATWARELSGPEVTNQFEDLPVPAGPTATYQEVVLAQIPFHYFSLNNTLTDSVSAVSLQVNGITGGFTHDILTNENRAYSFTSADDALLTTEDIINGGSAAANSTANSSGSLSFLFRMLSDTTNNGQRFLFNQGTNTATAFRNALGLFLESTNDLNLYPNSLKLRVGNTTAGGSSVPPLLLKSQLIPNAWYYFAMTWDETRNNDEVHWFVGPVGGTLTNGIFNPANDSTVGDGQTTFLIGNRLGLTSGFRDPGNGIIDEFATWNGELTAEEITAQFSAALRAPAVVSVSLSITRSGESVTLSWTNVTGFQLQSTTSLSPVDWQNVSTTPTVNGDQASVTLPISNNSFFRLIKP